MVGGKCTAISLWSFRQICGGHIKLSCTLRKTVIFGETGGVSGLVLLFVVIFLLCWISKTQKKKKKKGPGGKKITL